MLVQEGDTIHKARSDTLDSEACTLGGQSTGSRNIKSKFTLISCPNINIPKSFNFKGSEKLPSGAWTSWNMCLLLFWYIKVNFTTVTLIYLNIVMFNAWKKKKDLYKWQDSYSWSTWQLHHCTGHWSRNKRAPAGTVPWTGPTSGCPLCDCPVARCKALPGWTASSRCWSLVNCNAETFKIRKHYHKPCYFKLKEDKISEDFLIK